MDPKPGDVGLLILELNPEGLFMQTRCDTETEARELVDVLARLDAQHIG